VIHETPRLIFGIKDSQISVDTVMGTFERHPLLKKIDQLFFITKLLIELDDVFEMVWVNNHVLATQGSHAEFLSAHTSKAHCLPTFGDINFLCSIECSLVLFKLYVGLRQFLEVMHLFVEDLASKIKSIVEATITRLLDISLIGLRDKLL